MQIEPFHQRLRHLLDELLGRTQAWLAEQSGFSTAMISRVMSGKREPDLPLLEAIAPVLGLLPSELVRGTDAEPKLERAGEWIRRQEHEATSRALAAAQLELKELHARVSRREGQLKVEKEAHSACANQRESMARELAELHHQKALLKEDNTRLSESLDERVRELARHQRALLAAARQIEELRQTLEGIQGTVESTRRGSMITRVLAGVAALGSVVTATTLLTSVGDNDEDQDDT